MMLKLIQSYTQPPELINYRDLNYEDLKFGLQKAKHELFRDILVHYLNLEKCDSEMKLHTLLIIADKLSQYPLPEGAMLSAKQIVVKKAKEIHDKVYNLSQSEFKELVG